MTSERRQQAAERKKVIDKKRRDGYELFLHDRPLNNLGRDLTLQFGITFHPIDGKDPCRVAIQPSPPPVYVKDGQFGRASCSLTASRFGVRTACLASQSRSDNRSAAAAAVQRVVHRREDLINGDLAIVVRVACHAV